LNPNNFSHLLGNVVDRTYFIFSSLAIFVLLGQDFRQVTSLALNTFFYLWCEETTKMLGEHVLMI